MNIKKARHPVGLFSYLMLRYDSCLTSHSLFCIFFLFSEHPALYVPMIKKYRYAVYWTTPSIHVRHSVQRHITTLHNHSALTQQQPFTSCHNIHAIDQSLKHLVHSPSQQTYAVAVHLTSPNLKHLDYLKTNNWKHHSDDQI